MSTSRYKKRSVLQDLGSLCTTKPKVSFVNADPGRDLYRLADNLSVHYFGNNSELFYEKDIPRDLYDAGTAKSRLKR